MAKPPRSIRKIGRTPVGQRTPEQKATFQEWYKKNRPGATTAANRRPQFRMPPLQMPEFLMDLLGGEGLDYQPRSSSQLMYEAGQMAQGQVGGAQSQIQSMLQGGTRTIRELTQEIAGRMAPIAGQVQGLYGAAGTQTQAVNDALANRLASLGAAEQQGLSEALASAGLPGSQPLAQQVGNQAAAASQASFATGSSALNRLAAEGAAGAAYAATLPGVASLGGQAALAALTREAQAQAAGIAGQLPGLQQEALRTLTAAEETRAGRAEDRRTQLASALMDWNQQLRNLVFQKYVTDLGFHGDERRAAQSAAEFAASMGIRAEENAQDQANWAAAFGLDVAQFEEGVRQFGIGQEQEAAEAAAAAEEEGREEHAALVGERNDYIDSWTNRASSKLNQLVKGYKVTVPPKDKFSEATTETRKYTRQQARTTLLNFLLGPLLNSAEGKRFGIKRQRVEQIVNDLINSAPPDAWAQGTRQG